MLNLSWWMCIERVTAGVLPVRLDGITITHVRGVAFNIILICTMYLARNWSVAWKHVECSSYLVYITWVYSHIIWSHLIRKNMLIGTLLIIISWGLQKYWHFYFINGNSDFKFLGWFRNGLELEIRIWHHHWTDPVLWTGSIKESFWCYD